MNLDQLKIFKDAAELGSFAEAARKNARDPSYISRTVSQIETHLGVRLFQRSTRKLSLTEAGNKYLSKIIPIIEQLNEAEHEVKNLKGTIKGQLKITASQAFGQICLLPIINDFLKLYPSITVDLQLTDRNIDLFENHIDIACRLSPSFESDLIGIKLFDTHYLICASPDYLGQNDYPLSIDQLQQHRFLVYSHQYYRSRWLFKNKLNDIEKVNIQSSLAISSPMALLTAALQGMGVILIADWMAQKYLNTGQLVQILPDYQVTATDFKTAAWLLYPSRKYLPLKTRTMINYIQTRLSEQSQ